MRATSAPHRMSSASVVVRWDPPRASSTIASRRLVLPAPLGPQTSCGPAPKCASSVPYARRSVSRSRFSMLSCAPSSARSSGPGHGAVLRGRANRHHDVNVLVIADGLEDTGSQRPLELEGELLGVDLLED